MGGGIAIIYRKDLQITKSDEYQFETCECTDFKISFDQYSYTLGLFYRPEYYPFLAFTNDIVEYMENNITDKSKFLLLGDFNIHINKLHDDEAVTLHDFLSSFGLQNHVMFPRHRSQNILDLVITHESADIVSNFMLGEMISDHFAVQFNLHIPSKPRQDRIIKFRKVKEIDASSFGTDFWKALNPLTSPDVDELSKLVDGYNQAVAAVLDQHAPLKTKRVENECYQPWYCSDIGDAVRNGRKLERIWRADVKNKNKWIAFNKQRKVTQAIIKKSEKEYYHQLFLEKASNPKEVFSIANALLPRNNISPLPKYSSLLELANGFNKFFVDKISSIRGDIINTHFNGIQPTPVEPVNELNFQEMASFHGISKRNVKK